MIESAKPASAEDVIQQMSDLMNEFKKQQKGPAEIFTIHIKVDADEGIGLLNYLKEQRAKAKQ